jgi:hypothetical protein
VQVPATAAQFVALIVIALPGIVFATVRTRARGITAADVSLSSRIAQGLVAGVVIDSTYVLIIGDNLVKAVTLVDGKLPSIRAAAAYALVLGVLVPAAVAWVLHGRLRWSPPSSGRLASFRGWATIRWSSVGKWVSSWAGNVRPDRLYSGKPNAWDYAVPMMGRMFVRIETVDGKFVGGWFAEDSFISTYPEPHDIYVERQYRMSESGEFLSLVAGTAGFWYYVQPGDIIDWIDPSELEETAGNTNGV